MQNVSFSNAKLSKRFKNKENMTHSEFFVQSGNLAKMTAFAAQHCRQLSMHNRTSIENL